jgi:hypothetical protein
MAPISVGELIDKITILQIKQQEIKNLEKKNNITVELTELQQICNSLQLPDIGELQDKLYHVNRMLWLIEDFKRSCEKKQKFDIEFVEAARSVYIKNDQRAAIKREINTVCGSVIVEEKSYGNI